MLRLVWMTCRRGSICVCPGGVAWRAPGGPPKAKPGADARPTAPRRGAALVQYGSTRQCSAETADRAALGPFCWHSANQGTELPRPEQASRRPAACTGRASGMIKHSEPI